MNDWSTLKKGDKLYLLIPYYSFLFINKEDEDFNEIVYHYQESQVINVHHYDWCVNIRFKYTDQNGKRQRIELCVNKYKFSEDAVSSCKETSWARDYIPQYGDLLVTYKNPDILIDIYNKCKLNRYNFIGRKLDRYRRYQDWLQKQEIVWSNG